MRIQNNFYARLVFGLACTQTPAFNNQPYSLDNAFKPIASTTISNDNVESQLAQLAKPFVKELSHDITLYSWAPRAQLKLPNGEIPASMKKALANANLEYSSDPVLTRSQGGDDWALVELDLPNKTSFLDLRQAPEQVQFNDALKAGLESCGCHAGDLPALLKSTEPGCVQQAKRLQNTLKTKATADWETSTPFKNLPSRRGGSFKLSGIAGISPNQITVLTQKGGTKGVTKDTRAAVQRMFQEAREEASSPYPQLSDQARALDFNKAVASKLFGSAKEDSSVESTGVLKAEYAKLLDKARELSTKQGVTIDPERFRDVISRRFINRPDWERSLDSSKADPREVYDPKPVTWDNWQKVTDQGVAPLVQNKEHLTDAAILEWNKGAIVNTVPAYVKGGELKRFQNYGKNVSRATAMSAESIKALLSIRFDGESEPALKWTPLVCKEDLPQNIAIPGDNPECREIEQHAKQFSADKFWKDTADKFVAGKFTEEWYWFACWPRPAASALNATDKQCGMITYPDPATVPTRLKKIIQQVNDYVDQPAATKGDPIDFALSIQRQMVALHPFNKGNGRASRWVMDYITSRENLPPVVVQNMDYDMSKELPGYQQEGREGVREELQRMAHCLRQYQSRPAEQIKDGPCGLVTR